MPTAPTFLVLDDDENSRFLHGRALKKQFPDCVVVECATADEAMALAGQQSFAAVITDHHLRGAEGTSFIAQLRRQDVDCPVLMVTGSDDPNIHREAYAAGATKVFHGANFSFASYLGEILKEGGSRA